MKFTVNGYNVELIQDEDAQSPEDGGNTDLFLVTTRNRYFEVRRDGFDLDGIRDGAHKKDYHAVPLFAYIHSGVALSTLRRGQFADQWDSGQAGMRKPRGNAKVRECAETVGAFLLDTYTSRSGEERDVQLTDALADLMHFAYSHRLNFEEALNSAYGHAAVEQQPHFREGC